MNQNLMEELSEGRAGRQWKRIGTHHHHGMDVALFSLKTRQSTGIGEFPDLIPLIDWLADLGMDVLQLLPLNDSGYDASPYNALSAFALNPLHIGIKSLARWDSDGRAKKIVTELESLNDARNIDYAILRRLKDAFFELYFQQEKSQLDRQFIEDNRDWLLPYAQFRSLKEKNDLRSWEHWSNHDVDSERVDYYCFLQWLAFQQFSAVHGHGKQKGVFLKGDIPILISRDSADVWNSPDLFLLNYSAGAPPDMYCPEGQKWGFPLYNWENLERQDYSWWRRRLEIAESFYDIYRIDHIVGFYRIWAVPLDKDAREGFFLPGDESTWVAHGDKIMRMMLNSSFMLPIGEDLGVIPPPVRQHLKELGIAGTKIMRWERLWNEDTRFIPAHDYLPESMTSVSTHDSETLGQWWESDEGEYYARTHGMPWERPLTVDGRKAILGASHRTASLFHINLMQEYTALFPELCYDDERINVPGTVTDTNWSCRIKTPLETVSTHEGLREALGEILP